MTSSPVDHSSQQENTTNLVPIYPAFNDEFNAESYEDYFRNKVEEEDLEKFTKFKQLQISVIRNK